MAIDRCPRLRHPRKDGQSAPLRRHHLIAPIASPGAAPARRPSCQNCHPDFPRLAFDRSGTPRNQICRPFYNTVRHPFHMCRFVSQIHGFPMFWIPWGSKFVDSSTEWCHARSNFVDCLRNNSTPEQMLSVPGGSNSSLNSELPI